MKKYIIFILIAIMASLGASAQKEGNKAERERWFREMRQFKHEFIAKELDLTKEQQEKFFPLYDEMESSTRKLNRETRAMERRVKESGDKATDIEYEKAAEAMFELKTKEGNIEQSYLKKFKTVLTPRQLYKLKMAERKFTREVMKHHSKAKNKK